MNVKEAIFEALSTIAPTFPVVAPLNAPRKRIRYQGIGGSDVAAYDGDGNGASSRRVQIDCYADEFEDASDLADAARAALYAYPGLTVGEITDNPDDYEEDTKLNCVSFDVNAWL